METELKIGFIGAGAVNFGGGEGPWDHASRLEKLPGLHVVGVADPDTSRAAARLAERPGSLYANARVYADFRELLARAKPHAVWIGVPPNVHGTTEPGHDIELACAAAGVHMFVEKPLSAARPDQVRKVAEAVARARVITSVGYMFRYARAVDLVRQALAQAPGGVKVFLARYNCAYSQIRKSAWWDTRQSGGPIVEQATHFVDLARYLVGDAMTKSVRALSVPGAGVAGKLSDMPVDNAGRPFDADVPPEFANPRATTAIWQFTNGALGCLTHGILLHGQKYQTELELWADGLHLVLQDPYGRTRLLVRRPHSEATEELAVPDDDPYLTEDRVFVEAVRRSDPAGVRSPYADALKTFELTWAIADAAQPAK